MANEYQVHTRLTQESIEKIKNDASPDGYIGLWLLTTILKKDYICITESHIRMELVRRGMGVKGSVTLMYAARISIKSVLNRLLKRGVLRLSDTNDGRILYKRGKNKLF